jgi:hypothetical protein
MAANQHFEQTTNAILPSIPRRDRRIRDFVIPRFKLRGYLPVSVYARLFKTPPGELPDEAHIEGLLLDRMVGFDPGARRVCE